jgi:tetratricopeptide (TPR) repeat protein
LGNPLLLDAQVGRGVALLAKGRVKEASAILDRAAQTSPDSAKAIAARALGLLVAKQVGRAIATLDPSIANGSEEPLMFLPRGKAFYQNGELERANADFDQALKLRPLLSRRADGARVGMAEEEGLCARRHRPRPVPVGSSEHRGFSDAWRGLRDAGKM